MDKQNRQQAKITVLIADKRDSMRRRLHALIEGCDDLKKRLCQGRTALGDSP